MMLFHGLPGLVQVLHQVLGRRIYRLYRCSGNFDELLLLDVCAQLIQEEVQVLQTLQAIPDGEDHALRLVLEPYVAASDVQLHEALVLLGHADCSSLLGLSGPNELQDLQENRNSMVVLRPPPGRQPQSSGKPRGAPCAFEAHQAHIHVLAVSQAHQQVLVATARNGVVVDTEAALHLQDRHAPCRNLQT